MAMGTCARPNVQTVKKGCVGVCGVEPQNVGWGGKTMSMWEVCKCVHEVCVCVGENVGIKGMVMCVWCGGIVGTTQLWQNNPKVTQNAGKRACGGR